MKNNKAVTMISLVVTIVLIIIIASITSYYLSSTIEDVQYKDVKEELKNVENVVEYAKTQILIDEFMPDEENFKITDYELVNNFGQVLTNEEIEYIKQVNNSTDIKAPYKYYLMNQGRFDKEFGNDYNVSNLRPAREYLVNYMDTLVICNYGNEKIANSETIIPVEGDEKAEIEVAFTPNGNIDWMKQQGTMVSIKTNSTAVMSSSKYLWSQSYTEPKASEFSQTISDGQSINLQGKTGNDWYVWVYISYKEDGIEKTYITRSNPFYIDNTPPSAELEVEELDM